MEPWVSSLVFPLVCINQLRFTKLASCKIFCCDTRVESNDSLHGKKNKYSNEIVVTEVYGICGEEDHDIYH